MGGCFSLHEGPKSKAPAQIFLPDEDFIDPKRLQEGHEVGTGANGVKVLSAKLLMPEDGSSSEVAIKILLADQPSAADAFMKEVKLTLRCQAPHLVHCYGWTHWGAGLALVMKLYKCTLRELIDDQVGDTLPMPVILRLGLDIARGLAEVHAQHVIFEDLKPDNVLVDEGHHAVLADLGLSRFMGEKPMLFSSTVGGTLYYMAPEKLHNGKRFHGYFSDVWSYGVTMLQLLQSNLFSPYGPGSTRENIVMQIVVQKEAPVVPATSEAPGLQPLLQSCLNPPESRPTAQQIVKNLEAMLHALLTQAGPDSHLHASQLEKETGGKHTRLQCLEFDERGTKAKLEAHRQTAVAAPGQSPQRSEEEGQRTPPTPAKAPTHSSPKAVVEVCVDPPSLGALRDAFKAVSDHSVHHTFVLGGRDFTKLFGDSEEDLVLPPSCTITTGSIHLPPKCKIRLSNPDVHLDLLSIMGAEERDYAVEVCDKGSSARMQECYVQGGRSAALGVRERASLVAWRSKFCGGKQRDQLGSGMHVCSGGDAVLKRCCADGNDGIGWWVQDEWSRLEAADSSCSYNAAVNLYINNGASAKVWRCRLDCARGQGLMALKSSTATCRACSFSDNGTNVVASTGSLIELTDGCRCDGSRDGWGLYAYFNNATIAVDKSCSVSHNNPLHGNIYQKPTAGGKIVHL